ncbi:DUF4330 family protein [Myxacorys almedinensis A]|uniref:DUF4330 family protein n=2 Tax=Myxacorys TaxID=2056239 RepID=A0A8J7Z5T2_9CYAN|nr:DUF4330 family protein [Myxacorys almedinensis A]
MAIVDAQGRLFGRFSILDLGAGLVILMVIFGIFFFPGKSGSSIASNADRLPVEVDVLVRGLNASNPKDFMKEGAKTSVIVRKQPTGDATLTSVRFLPRNMAVTQPDGSLKILPDPRPESAISNDMVLTLRNNAQVVGGTPIFGGEKVKVGTTLELDGPTYNFASSVIAVRILDKKS